MKQLIRLRKFDKAEELNEELQEQEKQQLRKKKKSTRRWNNDLKNR